MHTEYWMDVFRLEHEERLRAAGMQRLAAGVPATNPVRRRFGSALIRLGVLVGGPGVARPSRPVPAHTGGAAR